MNMREIVIMLSGMNGTKEERPTIKSQVDFEKKLKNFRNKKLHDNKACTSANQNQ